MTLKFQSYGKTKICKHIACFEPKTSVFWCDLKKTISFLFAETHFCKNLPKYNSHENVEFLRTISSFLSIKRIRASDWYDQKRRIIFTENFVNFAKKSKFSSNMLGNRESLSNLSKDAVTVLNHCNDTAIKHINNKLHIWHNNYTEIDCHTRYARCLTCRIRLMITVTFALQFNFFLRFP